MLCCKTILQRSEKKFLKAFQSLQSQIDREFQQRHSGKFIAIATFTTVSLT